MRTLDELLDTLERLEGRSYKAYKDIRGRYDAGWFGLDVLYVQGDPFASPSRVEIRLPNKEAGIPDWAFSSQVRVRALCDWIHRRLEAAAPRCSRRLGTGKGGQLQISRASQKVLARTSVQWREQDDAFAIRLSVGLPARGRRIMGRAAADLFAEQLPDLIEDGACFEEGDAEGLRRQVETVEDAAAMRGQLRDRGLLAFVADGAILPRQSGVDDRPMEAAKAVPFAAPPSLRVELERPNGPPVPGMGIGEGVNLIVGGGFHGKSTLLEALQTGMHDHPPGDGREFVLTREDAVKIRAEDGRAVTGTDISAFIRDLPDGTDTTAFTSKDASGSTSQAAAIAEALEAGSRLLLIDEDTSATNFMIRDARMQALIHRDGEPITPLIERIRALYTEAGVSVILVMGGSGDFFDCADTVIGLRDYHVEDLTSEARRIAAEQPRTFAAEAPEPFALPRKRGPDPRSIDPSKGRRDVKTRSRALRSISFGTEEIELDAVEQLVETSQLNAIAAALVEARGYFEKHPRADIGGWVREVAARVAAEGPESLTSRAEGDFAEFRAMELAAALSRLRSLRVRPSVSE